LSVEGYGLHLIEGLGDTLWIGGLSKPTVSIASTHQSYAYLAKLDRLGHVAWVREFGGQTEGSIQSMAALPSGDIVVSGQDSERTWLARISSDGNIVWERFIGLGKGSAITTMDGAIVLAALDADWSDYRESVVAWTFNQVGEMLDRRVVREEINRAPGVYAGQIQIGRSRDAIYVFSAWIDPMRQFMPLEVAKLNLSDGIVWRKELPATALRGRTLTSYCFPAISISPDGDPLIACTVQKDEIMLLRLNSMNGNSTQARVRIASPPPPSCGEFWPVVSLMKEGPQTTVWLFGSPYDSLDPNVCGWIGEAATPEIK
jgi:hypothetical protein